MAETTILGIEHIVKTPDVLGGSPRIAGKRVSVHMIAEQYANYGVSIERLAESFDLSPAQVHAALAYYYDHRSEIEALILADKQAMERLTPFTVPESEQDVLREKWRAAKQARIAALSNPNREITVSEVAQAYGISAQAVREACKAGWVAARKSGATWLIRHADAENRWGGRQR